MGMEYTNGEGYGGSSGNGCGERGVYRDYVDGVPTWWRRNVWGDPVAESISLYGLSCIYDSGDEVGQEDFDDVALIIYRYAPAESLRLRG